MSYAFISYSKLNRNYARQIARHLLAMGFDIWIDDERIEYGVSWWDAIVRGVENCAVLVVIMTPESEKSEWVEREVFLALELKKPVFPLLLNGRCWPLFLTTQYVDVKDGSLPGDKLKKRITEYITPKTKAPATDKTAMPAAHAGSSTGFDIDRAIKTLRITYRKKLWSESLEILGRIRASKEDPFPLNPDELELKIRQRVKEENEARRRAEREQKYNRVRDLVDFGEADIICNALTRFHEEYPDYDPDKLWEKYCTPESDSGLQPIVSTTPKPPPITPEQQKLLDIMLNPAIEPPQRAEAGRKLAQIGDPRPGVGLRPDGLPDFDWVKIPEGEFIYQDAEKLHLPTFYISRYPVTYLQFKTFLDADDGFKNQQWWEGLAADDDDKSKPGKQAWKYSNHPREMVNWYDSMVFCRWLSYKFTGNIPDIEKPLEWPVRLPTEQEWEKAARGTDGRIYPWGQKYISGYANIDETEDKIGKYYLRQTTAVGIYPQGVSPYGVLDMSGNVWEWTLTEYSSKLVNNITNDSNRVLRGGSWHGSYDSSRAAYRDHDTLNSRSSDVGVRVVCASPFS